MTNRFNNETTNTVSKNPFGATPRQSRAMRDAGHQSLLLRRNNRLDRRANRTF